PKIPGFIHVPFNDIDAIKAVVNEKTCAIMLEPIQGEGGVNEASDEYITELRRICDQNKILLIFDEVQTGIGRTGKLYAYEHYNIEPDIMTLAKGIGGGYPLSAMLAKDYLNIFEAGDQGGTYSSQPLGMAVGLAVVNEIIQKNMSKNAETKGQYIIDNLIKISKKYGLKNIRGKGLLLAFDLPKDIGKDFVTECFIAGLLLNSPKPATIRLMPALIVSKKDINKMIGILTQVLDRIL
ncbi:MAG TPA: aminotransferase class III-fold pyridoxal phosphate-dependent enzyme, partial [Clostridia bacterium]